MGKWRRRVVAVVVEEEYNRNVAEQNGRTVSVFLAELD